MTDRRPHMRWRGGFRKQQAAAAVGVPLDLVLDVHVYPPNTYVFYTDMSNKLFAAKLRRDTFGGFRVEGDPLDQQQLEEWTADGELQEYVQQLIKHLKEDG